MDDRMWKNVSIGLGVICAILIGVAGALMIVGNRGGSSAGTSAQPSLISGASATPGARTSGPSSSGSSTAPQGGSPSPSAPPGPVKPATIVFNGLMLDAENDKAGAARVFTFTGSGDALLTIAVAKTSPSASTRLCISADGAKATCAVGSLPSFKKARGDAGAKNDWKVTVVGYGNSKPTIDLTLTWPTDSPKVTLSHGRLQGGSSAEGLNGFTATFQPRSEGAVNVQASWTAVTANVEMTLSDVTTAPAVKVDQRQYQGVTYVNPPYTYNVDSTKAYLLKLRDTSADSGRPDLTVQVTFP